MLLSINHLSFQPYLPYHTSNSFSLWTPADFDHDGVCRWRSQRIKDLHSLEMTLKMCFAAKDFIIFYCKCGDILRIIQDSIKGLGYKSMLK